MSNLYRIFVPSTEDANKAINVSEHNKRAESVAAWLSGKFGGYTQLNGNVGGWLSDTLGLIVESTIIVESAGDDSEKDAVIEYCKQLRQEWSQEAIMLQIVPLDVYFV